jgi:hypothetical protein
MQDELATQEADYSHADRQMEPARDNGVIHDPEPGIDRFRRGERRIADPVGVCRA